MIQPEPTSCPSANILSAFAEGRLPAAERDGVRRHAGRCIECEIVLAALGAPSSDLLVESGTASVADRRTLPATFGRYRLLAELGAGTFGVVYEAHDEQLDRRVAVKVLRAAWSADAGRRARFVREARAMARIKHPNVVAIYDAGEIDGTPFISMELKSSASLSVWLAGSSRTLREVLEAFVGVGEGLAHAHGVGLVHRDLKPRNILVDRDGRMILTDFGLARFAASSADEGERAAAAVVSIDEVQTCAGALVGTPAYMAPEQLRGEEADARSDQYAFGLCLLEAVQGERLQSLAAERRSGAAVRQAPGQRRRFTTPAALSRVIERALSTAPEDRYESVSAMVLELRAIVRRLRDGDGASPRAVAPAVAEGEDSAAALAPGARRGSRRRTWRAGLIALGVLAVVAVGLAFATASSSSLQLRWHLGDPSPSAGAPAGATDTAPAASPAPR